MSLSFHRSTSWSPRQQLKNLMSLSLYVVFVVSCVELLTFKMIIFKLKSWHCREWLVAPVWKMKSLKNMPTRGRSNKRSAVASPSRSERPLPFSFSIANIRAQISREWTWQEGGLELTQGESEAGQGKAQCTPGVGVGGPPGDVHHV